MAVNHKDDADPLAHVDRKIALIHGGGPLTEGSLRQDRQGGHRPASPLGSGGILSRRCLIAGYCDAAQCFSRVCSEYLFRSALT